MAESTMQQGYLFLIQLQREGAFAALDRNHAHQRRELLPLFRRNARGSQERGLGLNE